MTPPYCGFSGTDGGQIGPGRHGDGDASVPGSAQSHLVVVQAALARGDMEALLHLPSHPSGLQHLRLEVAAPQDDSRI